MGNNKSTLFRRISLKNNNHQDGQSAGDSSSALNETRKQLQEKQSASLVKLFEKLELTAEEGNIHPGELSRITFENAFHGPLHIFGKLMYLQMMSSSHGHRDRITREQFVKAGREVLKLHEEKVLVKYYFHLFASEKDFLTPEDAKQMFEVSFALTLSLSKILYNDDNRDSLIFSAMVTGLFGIKTQVSLEEFAKWHKSSCPELFHNVHSWLNHILTGSALPEELENSRVPMLQAVTCPTTSISMAILWLLSIVLPPAYTKQKTPKRDMSSASAALAASVDTGSSVPGSTNGVHSKLDKSYSATKDPMWTSMLLLRKMARMTQCESWKMLYNSESHGLSANRFNHHVTSYQACNLTFFTFEGRNKYCMAMDTGYREGPNRLGGEDCRLIQLMPVYRVLQAGSGMCRWNEKARTSPQGISVGCEGRAEVLRIPKDFDKITHHGVSCELYKMEVWGCGCESALESQRVQKKWEAGAVSREQGKKLRPYGEKWDDTPDTQLLQWGGVNVGQHSYNR